MHGTELPRVFIGSSVKGEPIARAVEENLNYRAETYLWTHMFPPGKGTLEALVQAAATVDFAVLILTPDDLTESKGQKFDSPRDNVLFELGLFLGRLGRERSFAVCNRDDAIKLPTDLAGVTLAMYPNYSGKNLRAQVSSASTPILGAIEALGRARRTQEINPRYEADLMKLDGKWELAEVMDEKTVIVVVGDGLVSELLDRPIAGVARDEIDSHSGGNPLRRAVIMSHSRWAAEPRFHLNPTLSIGAQASNKLSGEILETLEAQGKEKFELGAGGWGAFVAAIPESPASDESPAVAALGPRVALFGQKATETRTAVENYIRREQGLRQFLKDHAGWKIV